MPIELVGNVKRPPRGLVVRNESIFADEVTTVAGLRVTTVARTAFDLGRHGNRDEAIARLDALKRATNLGDVDVDHRVGAEYDGDQHRADRLQYAKDVNVKRKLAAMQWNVTYVIKEDRPRRDRRERSQRVDGSRLATLAARECSHAAVLSRSSCVSAPSSQPDT